MTKHVAAIALAALSLLGGKGCQRPPGGSSSHAITATTPCGARPAHPGIQHVVWVVFENHARTQIIGSRSAPGFTWLAGACGQALHDSDHGLHPSLPNYITLLAGSALGVRDDAGPGSHALKGPTLTKQLGAGWRFEEESMPSACRTADAGQYVVRHNPQVYFTDERARCATQNRPIGTRPDLSARFTWIQPDNCHSMHSNSCPGSSNLLGQGDAFLRILVARLVATPQYQAGHTVVFVTFDEGSSGTGEIPLLVLSPSTRVGTRAAGAYDHRALLATTEDLLGLPRLATTRSAPSMAAAFGL